MESAAQPPVEGAAKGTHDAVLQLLGAPPGALLDAPCGAGAISNRASEAGFSVTGVDLIAPGASPLQPKRYLQADLNAPLPFEDASFDRVVSVEGIEHLEAPRAFVRELARVLRPGGRLIISTPNVLNMRSRLRWLRRGHHKHFTPQPDGRFSSDHLHAIDLFLLRRFLEEAGLECGRVGSNRLLKSAKEQALAWWVRRSTPRTTPHRSILLGDDLLYGQVLIQEATRPLDSTSVSP